jgi:hypothetical protein
MGGIRSSPSTGSESLVAYPMAIYEWDLKAAGDWRYRPTCSALATFSGAAQRQKTEVGAAC